jgi:toxin secretion/phage lysis holin
LFYENLVLTKHQTFSSSFITLLAYVYGLVSTPLFWILVIFSIIDFILGVYAALKNKQLNWDKCLDGIANKVFIGVLVLISALVDYVLNYFGINTKGIFHNFIMAALLTRELGSIVKNAEKSKLWIPKMIKDARDKLSQLTNEENKK